LWISPLENVWCFRHARGCKGSKGESNCRMRKRRQPDDRSIFIGTPKWMDPTNVVTPPNKCVV